MGGNSVVMYILTLYGVIISGSDWNAIQIAYIYGNYRFSVNSGNGPEGLWRTSYGSQECRYGIRIIRGSIASYSYTHCPHLRTLCPAPDDTECSLVKPFKQQNPPSIRPSHVFA